MGYLWDNMGYLCDIYVGFLCTYSLTAMAPLGTVAECHFGGLARPSTKNSMSKLLLAESGTRRSHFQHSKWPKWTEWWMTHVSSPIMFQSIILPIWPLSSHFFDFFPSISHHSTNLTIILLPFSSLLHYLTIIFKAFPSLSHTFHWPCQERLAQSMLLRQQSEADEQLRWQRLGVYSLQRY